MSSTHQGPWQDLPWQVCPSLIPQNENIYQIDNQPDLCNLLWASMTAYGSSSNFSSRKVSKYSLWNIAAPAEFPILYSKPLREDSSILNTTQVGSWAHNVSTSVVSAASQGTGPSLCTYKAIRFNHYLNGKPHTNSPSVGGQCDNSSHTK